ncbi:MAG: hypothetical protein QM820_22875 [Minicystis sp.]
MPLLLDLQAERLDDGLGDITMDVDAQPARRIAEEHLRIAEEPAPIPGGDLHARVGERLVADGARHVGAAELLEVDGVEIRPRVIGPVARHQEARHLGERLGADARVRAEHAHAREHLVPVAHERGAARQHAGQVRPWAEEAAIVERDLIRRGRDGALDVEEVARLLLLAGVDLGEDGGADGREAAGAARILHPVALVAIDADEGLGPAVHLAAGGHR